MATQLTFTEEFVYDDDPSGITVPVMLSYGATDILVSAKVDTGAQVCAEFQIARQYASRTLDRSLGRRIYRMLEEEYERACRVMLQITGERRLLDQSPVLQRSIAVRNPYVDPLSFLQVELLARRRQKDGKTEPSDSDREKLLYATLLTINGIAAGMRNTE